MLYLRRPRPYFAAMATITLVVALTFLFVVGTPRTASASDPAIASVSPTSGQPCSTITINGSGFGATQGDSTVTFDDAEASVVSWSDTSIKAIVPSDAVVDRPPTFMQSSIVVTVDDVASEPMAFGIAVDKWVEYLSVERLSSTRQRVTAHLVDLCGQPNVGEEIDWTLSGAGKIVLADASGTVLTDKTATTVSTRVENEGQSFVEVEITDEGWAALDAAFIQDEFTRAVTLQEGEGPPATSTPTPTYTWPSSSSSQIGGLVYNDLDGDGRFDQGKEWGIPLVQVDLVAPGLRFTTHSEADGAYHFVGLTYGTFDIEVNANAVPGFQMTTPAVLKNVKVSGRSRSLYNNFGYHEQAKAPPAAAAALPTGRAAQVKGNPEFVYFPETGHNLAYGFRHYWEKNGGLALFGFPITEEMREGGHTVQYFERARFEYFPQYKGTAQETQLGLVGSELVQGTKTFARVAAQPNTSTTVYFAQTGHTLSGAFLDFWRKNGGLARFGYPISEQAQEAGKTVQYFERARFEVATGQEAKGPVQLGLIGTELLKKRGLAP